MANTHLLRPALSSPGVSQLIYPSVHFFAPSALVSGGEAGTDVHALVNRSHPLHISCTLLSLDYTPVNILPNHLNLSIICSPSGAALTTTRAGLAKSTVASLKEDADLEEV